MPLDAPPAAAPESAAVPRRAGRHRTPGAPDPRGSRVWRGAALILASLGIGAMLPQPELDVGAATWASAISLAPAVSPAVPAAQPPAGTVGPPAPSTAPSASLPVSVSIPTLGVTAELVRLGLEADGTMQVPTGASRAGWYELGPIPGELGPAVLAGHVDWAGQPGVFQRIGELTQGDQIEIRNQDGDVTTFRVDHVDAYPKHSFPTDAVYGDLDHAGLRLITCGGEFDPRSGHYADNVIVFASLVPAA
jgi:hypothetical protein